MVAFPLILMNRLNNPESAVSWYGRLSLFLKDPFLQIILDLLVSLLLIND